MTAPLTPLEALEDLVDQLSGAEILDGHGRPIQRNRAYLTAVAVLDDRRPKEERSFDPDVATEDPARRQTS